MKAELILDTKAELGEGPSWCDREQVLYWVNILAGEVHVFDPSSRFDRVIRLGQFVGCLAPRRAGGLVVGLQAGIAALDLASEKLDFLAMPEQALPNNRFNDGKCDPRGRFLAGTMDHREQETTGSLYSLDGRRLKRLLSGVKISNGLAWSPDFSTLYFIDTPTLQVRAFDYDLESGDIRNPRLAVQVSPGDGFPDGMTADQEGMLWVAMWGGARLCRWNPQTGKLLARIDFPALHVTSCAFGGPDLTTLYVTTARKGMSASELENYPASGGLFQVETGIAGLPTFEFGAGQ